MHNSETKRFIKARHNSNDGIKTIVLDILISSFNLDGIIYRYGLFPDTGVSIPMNEYSYLRTYDTVEEAEMGEPAWLHWRQREALGLKRNPFEN
ncbi:hypothetical protein [Atlantibacter hermannii]|uniref:hypothetical protein n=1 Tax=Atlantibacter hermannii TaxID=565 RepID=UPI0028B102FB|nr:hypothetical protein [Atlantibacter hermannii]